MHLHLVGLARLGHLVAVVKHEAELDHAVFMFRHKPGEVQKLRAAIGCAVLRAGLIFSLNLHTVVQQSSHIARDVGERAEVGAGGIAKSSYLNRVVNGRLRAQLEHHVVRKGRDIKRCPQRRIELHLELAERCRVNTYDARRLALVAG